MPSSSQWIAFLTASVIFIQVPGPSLLFTIGRALSVGRRDALLSVLGNALGLLIQIVAVAAGLAAVVAASATAFWVLKVIGACYVIWLGIKTIRSRSAARLALAAEGSSAHSIDRDTVASAVRTGMLVGVTNPKTIVFFGAFLPQFVNHNASNTGLQIAALGFAFAVIAVLSDGIWALAAAKARRWFAAEPTRLDKLSATGGAMMIGLGGILLASE